MKTKTKRILIILAIVAVVVIAAFVAYKIYGSYHVSSILNSHPIDQNTLSGSESSENSQTQDESNTGIRTAVQQIMVGSLCNNYDHALLTLQNIKAAGYDAIELNDFMTQKTSPIVKLLTSFAGMPVGNGGKLDWPKLIDESGLDVISLHSNLGAIEADAEGVAANAKRFGTDIVVITGMYRFDYSNLDEVLDLAERLNAAGKELSRYGIRLLYHNHNCELQRVSDDKTAYDIIIENTDAEYVNFEFDSYWMTDGGANVPSLMKKLGSRMVLWHINDRGYTKAGPYMTPILTEDATELGKGNMDLDTLYEIALENGVEGIILETHQNWIDNDPILSMQVSYGYLQGRLEEPDVAEEN